MCRPPAAWRSRFPAVAAQAAGDDSSSKAASSTRRPSRSGRPSFISQDSEEDIAAARQRLQAYLQQQRGISHTKAAELAGKLSAKLGAAADQLVPDPLQCFVDHGMQPVKAAQLLVHMCKERASYMRQWRTWQPVVEVNWQLADSYLAAYQQQFKASKQRPLKSSESMAAMLSGMPSRCRMLLVANLPSKAALVQQQLGLTNAKMGQLVAGGLVLSGSDKTIAATIQWLASFAGSNEAAADMLRAGASLSYSTTTLDSKLAALQAAWDGVLQPEQVRQLLCKLVSALGNCSEDNYSATAAVLRRWFPQPSELYAVLHQAPQLLGAAADILQANERWFTGPPLSLCRQQFLERVRANPQPFFQNFEDRRMQHKLAFVTQVGGMAVPN